jgi:hypothetical protein
MDELNQATKGSTQKNTRRDVGAPREWYSRGYLPHRDARHLIQSISYRLADSLPQTKPWSSARPFHADESLGVLN